MSLLRKPQETRHRRGPITRPASYGLLQVGNLAPLTRLRQERIRLQEHHAL